MRNPEAKHKAQAEIDEVVGHGRLPNFSDRARLPYISAVLKEVFRCGLVLPIGVAHKLTEDDVYGGYFIPKDAIITYNVW